jgi:putative addiction module CopG family antidote
MEATRRLSIELPEAIAEAVEARVTSGEYASVSEVVREALGRLAAGDGAEEAWLRNTIAVRVKALDEGQTRTKSVMEVRASLAARRAGREQAA